VSQVNLVYGYISETFLLFSVLVGAALTQAASTLVVGLVKLQFQSLCL
jgi:hypothetical protein